ncbi:MAG TPA: cation:proton antiporter [Terriglobales bacterium]|nr:cation:proton antiporter [Terriglobales bacterium]
MESDLILFRDLTYIFVAAMLGGLAAWRLRPPLILGFIVGGIVVSPFTPGPHLSQLHTFEVFAEVGVVLLMFSIGVEFSPQELMRVKWVAIVGAPIGILAMVGIAEARRKNVRAIRAAGRAGSPPHTSTFFLLSPTGTLCLRLFLLSPVPCVSSTLAQPLCAD